MSDITTSLNGFLSILDALQVVRKPLQSHALSRLPEPEKKLYTTLLMMLVSNQPITENQGRLFGMLLISMGLEHDLQPLYTNIKNIDKASVLEFCQMCDTHELAISFLMDALTLCRLDNALSESQVKSISELVNLLKLDATDLAEVLHLSNVVLGERVTITEDSDEQIISVFSQLRLNFDYDKLKPWHEFGYQPIRDEKQIEAGVDGGLWLIDRPLQISAKDKVRLSNATMLFASQGSLSIDFQGVDNKDAINLNNCQMIGASFYFSESTARNHNININKSAFVNSHISCKDLAALKIKGSNFTGDKAHNLMRDYLVLDEVMTFEVESCLFSNCPQTSILLKDSNYNSLSSTIKNTVFSQCGSFENDKAGAIQIDNFFIARLDIEACEFLDNHSGQGADINLDYIASETEINVQNCSFINSNNDLEENHNSISIDIQSYPSYVLITDSKFENTSVLIKYYSEEYAYRTFKGVTLKNTTVVSNSTNEDLIFDKCVFNNANKPNLTQYISN